MLFAHHFDNMRSCLEGACDDDGTPELVMGCARGYEAGVTKAPHAHGNPRAGASEVGFRRALALLKLAPRATALSASWPAARAKPSRWRCRLAHSACWTQS
jgi:hypothetical protein